jgi:hypothetical protein
MLRTTRAANALVSNISARELRCICDVFFGATFLEGTLNSSGVKDIFLERMSPGMLLLASVDMITSPSEHCPDLRDMFDTISEKYLLRLSEMMKEVLRNATLDTTHNSYILSKLLQWGMRGEALAYEEWVAFLWFFRNKPTDNVLCIFGYASRRIRNLEVAFRRLACVDVMKLRIFLPYYKEEAAKFLLSGSPTSTSFSNERPCEEHHDSARRATKRMKHLRFKGKVCSHFEVLLLTSTTLLDRGETLLKGESSPLILHNDAVVSYFARLPLFFVVTVDLGRLESSHIKVPRCLNCVSRKGGSIAMTYLCSVLPLLCSATRTLFEDHTRVDPVTSRLIGTDRIRRVKLETKSMTMEDLLCTHNENVNSISLFPVWEINIPPTICYEFCLDSKGSLTSLTAMEWDEKRDKLLLHGCSVSSPILVLSHRRIMEACPLELRSIWSGDRNTVTVTTIGAMRRDDQSLCSAPFGFTMQHLNTHKMLYLPLCQTAERSLIIRTSVALCPKVSEVEYVTG